VGEKFVADQKFDLRDGHTRPPENLVCGGCWLLGRPLGCPAVNSGEAVGAICGVPGCPDTPWVVFLP
jgi:hypothetical protein